MEHNLIIGDVVTFNSGDHAMTVTALSKKRTATCVWSNKGDAWMWEGPVTCLKKAAGPLNLEQLVLASLEPHRNPVS